MGLLAGTVLGAGLGMLFAPKPGNELRNQLGEQAGRLKTTANDTYQQATEKVSQIVERGREAYRPRARDGPLRVRRAIRDSAVPAVPRRAASAVLSATGTTGGYTPAGTDRG